MNIDKKLSDIRRLEELSGRDSYLHRTHSLIMLFVTVIYIIILMTFDRYDITGILMMFLYPLVMFRLSELSFIESLKKMRYILPLIFLFGILNLFFEKEPYMIIGSFTVTKGAVSFINIFIKGALAVEASYILIATNSIYDICAALSMLRIPDFIVSLFLLTYRYLSLMGEEVSNMCTAYFLRAPGQRGLHISSWGSFLGQLLLRSFDRADELYSSMQLRGFTGNLRLQNTRKVTGKDIMFLVGIVLFLLLFRFVNVPVTIGNLIRRGR